MSKQYESLAKEIVRLIGGNENIESLHHCQTRLRFQLHNNEKANQEEISSLDGVAKVLINGGMFQIVIGMQVAEVYEEVIKLIDLSDASASEANPEKKNAFDTVADFISSIFSPIVPALAGAGMVKALLALLVAFHLIDTTTQTYTIINMFGDATFAFMPILLAYTTAQKLKCNPVLAAVTAGILCHATWTGLVATGEPVALFGVLPLYLVKYTNSVIPIVLVILVQAPLEKFLNKIIPHAVRLVFVPMILFLVMGTLSLTVLGPLGDYIGSIFTFVFSWLSENVGWLEAGLMGALYPILVIFGLHHGLAPLGTMQMAQMGYDAIFGPGVLCANIGQGTSALITGLLSKDVKEKQIATSSGITGLMGVTEPALYGVNVPKKFPLIAGCIGSAFGGLFAGFTHTHRYATGSSGLPAVMMYIGDNTTQFFVQIIIALAITMIISALMTVILFKRFQARPANASSTLNPAASTKNVDHNASSIQDGKIMINSPLQGNLLPLSQACDDAFASGALGDGIVIEPNLGEVVSPVNGTVATIFPTKHAIGLVSDEGVELLIHIGIDTVELNGKYFDSFVENGQQVTVGQPLVKFEIEKIKAAGYSTQVPVLITNSDEYHTIEKTTLNCINQKETLFTLS